MPLDAPRANRVRWPESSHVIFDCDSTLSAVEGIDVLAVGLGLEDEVARMTDAAMAGEIDLSDVYAERLQLLRPSHRAVAALRSAYKRNVVPDAAGVIRALRLLDIEVYVVSGGLAEPVEEFAIHLGIKPDNVRAVAATHDELSGEWWNAGQGAADEEYRGFEDGALTRSDGKAEVIAELLADKTGMSMLVGDGASDLEAATTVDLFVGYGGVVRRDHVAAAAPAYVTSESLAPILPIAAGPGGADRLDDGAAIALFTKGTALIREGHAVFRNAQRQRRLLAALDLAAGELEARHHG